MSVPMQNPQLTCDHHYTSYHQGDFPKAVYWVRICDLCKHIIPELTAGLIVLADNEQLVRRLENVFYRPPVLSSYRAAALLVIEALRSSPPADFPIAGGAPGDGTIPRTDLEVNMSRREKLLETARELMPEGQPIPIERLIAGMVEAGSTDGDWRFALEALLTSGEARYTDRFDVVRGTGGAPKDGAE